MKDKVPVACVLGVAIAAIVILEIYALHQGVNGVLFSLCVGAIVALASGFAGFRARDFWRK